MSSNSTFPRLGEVVDYVAAAITTRHGRKIYDHPIEALLPDGVLEALAEDWRSRGVQPNVVAALVDEWCRKVLRATRRELARYRTIKFAAVLFTRRYFDLRAENPSMSQTRFHRKFASTPGMIALGPGNGSAGIVTFHKQSASVLLEKRHVIVRGSATAKKYCVAQEVRFAAGAGALTSDEVARILAA
jgi:hypothetical protein